MSTGQSVVDRIAGSVRERILDGSLAPGARLVEADLASEHGAARHSVRTALRALAGERLVLIEANRGARVATLDPQEVVWLYELRTALEVEAAHLALHRHGGTLPPRVGEAAEALAAICRGPSPDWPDIARAHADFHGAIVASARSPRITEEHGRLEGEIRLLVLRIRPHWSLERLAADHLALPGEIERDGPEVLRPHLRAAAAALVDDASELA